MDTETQPSDVRTSYDRVADEYARRIYAELSDKPFDREVLDRFATALRGRGLVCDLGCGPGQVARYLADRGLPVMGVDFSAGMVAQARRLNPDLTFEQGDMRDLAAVPDGAWAGIAAFYAIIHVPRAAVTETLIELRRVLRSDGLLLLAFHLGDEVVHLDTWWERPVSADFVFFQSAEMTRYLAAAGFAIEAVRERDPYPEVEHQSRRAYLLARKPG